MKGFIVSTDYDTLDNQTRIEIYGRLENGQSFASFHQIKPYLFIKEKDANASLKLLSKFHVESTSLKTFRGEAVAKISADNQSELNKLSKAFHLKGVETYEADIKPDMRFLIDHTLLAGINIEGEYAPCEKVDRYYTQAKVTPSDFSPELKVLSIDIESDKDAKGLYCIGLYGKDFRKNFMITKHKINNVVSCSSEEECLRKFRNEVIKFDPDIITGWNFIDFDLAFLREKFREHKIPFDLGRTNREVRLRLESNFLKASSADIPGRQTLDAYSLIRDPFIKEAPTIKNADFESYTLEAVSQALLKEGKLIKGKDRHIEISSLYEQNTLESHKKLAEYNLQDCALVYSILEKTKTIELAAERSHLTGMPLDKTTASVAAFDSLYIREARKRGLVSPSLSFTEKEERIKGGYVLQPQPGIYHNILILDFKSLYPSIIRTFNIDPSSLLDKKEKGAIETPNKAFFKNEDGILPSIIEKLHQTREKAKREKRELATYALKITMNSFFGVLANPNSRYFNLSVANSITYFGQFIIQLTAKEIESRFKTPVIYQDTDSCFVQSNLEKESANALGEKIASEINSFYDQYVKENYCRKSFLELQFDKQFLSLLIPKLRGEEVAAKKRYAGLVEKSGKEEIQVTGLEAIRGDWVDAAQDFQMDLLKRVFHKKPIEQFIQDYIKKIKSGQLDEKLIYRKSIRKSLNEYTKTTPPHVKAARLLPRLESNLIQYYITTAGPEPIQLLKHPIDYTHYIKKQIEPIANQILILLNKSFEDVVKGSSQSKLF